MSVTIEPGDIMGYREIELLTGIPMNRLRQRHYMTKHGNPTNPLPVPLRELGMGPIWLRPDIVAWWEREKGTP